MFSCSTQQPQHFSHSVCEEIYPLLKFSSWHVVRGHRFLHCLFSIRVNNVIIIFFFSSAVTHITLKDFLAFIMMLWNTLTLKEVVYLHLSISHGHLLIRVKETAAALKEAAQMLGEKIDLGESIARKKKNWEKKIMRKVDLLAEIKPTWCPKL